MAFVDQSPSIPAAGLQSMSLVFGAASLAQTALNPPFLSQIAAQGTAAFTVINVDATLSELHSAEIELTSHPVETGANITDHARQKPREIKLDGFITNTPVDNSLANAAARAMPALGMVLAAGQSVAGALIGSSITRDAFDKFQQLYTNATLVNVFTPYRTYANMIMVSFSCPREQANGDALRFTAKFREVFFVTSQIVTIPNSQLAQPTLDMGTQSPSPAPAAMINNGVDPLLTGASTIFGATNLNTWLPSRQ